jgi:hypothetical protein
MLKCGWLNRYQPAIAMELVPDIVVIFGFVWSGLMFLPQPVENDLSILPRRSRHGLRARMLGELHGGSSIGAP